MPGTDSIDCCRLLRLAYRTASRIVRNRLLAEEAGERAVHRFHLSVIAGNPPARPEAWVRTVARHSACAMLRTAWYRTLPIAEDLDTVDRRRAAPSRRGEQLRALLDRALTPRQHAALEAALTCRTTIDAARACGMEPRDFRRYLAAITVRARRRLAAQAQFPASTGGR
jgi:hypothetical protein